MLNCHKAKSQTYFENKLFARTTRLADFAIEVSNKYSVFGAG